MTILVAIGAAIGGVARYLVSLAVNPSSGFPWGTFGINAVGSLMIGVFSGWLAHCAGNVAAIRAFAVVGFCGGFTTFSTFSNETLKMLDDGHLWMAFGYMAGSVIIGVFAVWCGYLISK